MALRSNVRFALIAGTAAVIAGGVGMWIWNATGPKPPALPGSGALLCPGDVGKDPVLAKVTRGDYVVVQLRSADGEYSESTWATVLSKTGDTIAAVLSGEQIPAGIRALATDKHGFRLGDPVFIKANCIWEVFHPVDLGEGQILCGPKITDLAKYLDDENLYPIERGNKVRRGDRAQILVASKAIQGTAWNERLWTQVIGISRRGQVITALIEDDPTLTEQHTLVRGSVVRYNRDCVIGV